MNSNTSNPPWQLATKSTNERLGVILQRGVFHDVIFKVEETGQVSKDYAAHKLILSCVSPVFERKFYAGDAPPIQNDHPFRVTESRFTQRAFETMLTYAYSPHGNVQFESPVHAMETYHVARAFTIDHLKEICSDYLRNKEFAPEDIIPLYEDELQTEIRGLHQKCLKVLEKKPLLVMRIAAEIAKFETIKEFLQKETLAVPSELALLQKIVHGAQFRHYDENDEIENLNLFLRKLIFPLIRFLTMSPQQFSVAFTMCKPVITKNEGFEIFYKLCQPQLSHDYEFPAWGNKSTKSRTGDAQIIELIPTSAVIGRNPLTTNSLTSKLGITVNRGNVIFTGLWLRYRRLTSRSARTMGRQEPSAQCILNIRNGNQMIAYDVVKDLKMDDVSSEKHLPFDIPLTVLCDETAEMILTLNDIQDLEFYEFERADLPASSISCAFNLKLSNQRSHDKIFAISKVDYTLLYT